MNIHVPQNMCGTMELQSFMSVTSHIVSAQQNAPCMGLVQDGLLGVYILTSSTTYVTRDVFFNSLMTLKEFPNLNEFMQRVKKYYPKIVEETARGTFRFSTDHIPGKILFSIVFPRDFFYNKRTEDDEEAKIKNVIINDGIIVKNSRPLCKKVLGAKANTIHHYLYKEYSPEHARDFLSNAQFVINSWFPTRGFSVGISDCLIENYDAITDTLAQTQEECREKIQIGNETLEQEINSILNSATNVGMKLTQSGMKDGQQNGFVMMYKSGAKGNHINCSQITAFVGQQNVKGQRITKTLTNNTRCLPYYEVDDESPAARGFVDRAYYDGLTPQQVYMHAQGGREGLIDTAIKTSESGYAQRRIVKKEEDLKVCFDNTVRSNNNNILQFLYGNDGYDASRLYYVDGEPFFIDPARIATKLNASRKEGEKLSKITASGIEKICNTIRINHLQVEAIEAITQKTRSKLGKLLATVKIAPSKYEEFGRIIEGTFYRSLAEGGDMVGIISASSIGEPTTQGTLNSVEWNTEMVMCINNQTKKFKIGEWIDNLLDTHKKKIKYYPENRTQYLELDHKVDVPTVDDKGIVTWGAVTAITKHLPVGELVKITTKSGRSAIATRSKSFLVWSGKKFVQTPGSEIKLNDQVPVNYTLEKKSGAEEWIDAKELIRLFDTYGRVDIQKNVVLDTVVSIEDFVSEYEYVYDLTVPSTKNFCIANGLGMADTFHYAGVSGKDVTLGVVRLKELLDATKNPKTPSCLVYLDTKELEVLYQQIANADGPEKAQFRKQCLETVKKYRKEIQYNSISTFLKSPPVLKKIAKDDPKGSPIDLFTYENYEEEWWVSFYKDLHKSTNYVEAKDWVIELEFDIEAMYAFDITLGEIAEIIQDDTSFAITTCIPSPNNIGKIIVFIDYSNATEPAVEKIGLDTGNEYQLITEDNINFYYARDIVIKKIESIKIGGINGISKTFPHEVNGEWVIDTQGCNFQQVLNLRMADATRTICDDFWQINKCLGIEAAREMLIIELTKCMSFDGSYINHRHVELLVDSMTSSGTITSVRREGIDRSCGPLAKCAFEKTVDNFALAATFCEKEDVSGVSASITLGKLINGGTGYVHVLPDEKFYKPQKIKPFQRTVKQKKSSKFTDAYF